MEKVILKIVEIISTKFVHSISRVVYTNSSVNVETEYVPMNKDLNLDRRVHWWMRNSSMNHKFTNELGTHIWMRKSPINAENTIEWVIHQWVRNSPRNGEFTNKWGKHHWMSIFWLNEKNEQGRVLILKNRLINQQIWIRVSPLNEKTRQWILNSPNKWKTQWWMSNSLINVKFNNE